MRNRYLRKFKNFLSWSVEEVKKYGFVLGSVDILYFLIDKLVRWIYTLCHDNPVSIKLFESSTFFVLCSDKGIGVDLRLLRKREPIITDILMNLLKNDNRLEKKVFLDVGANLGYYSVILGKNFRKVIAVEPYPKICPLLKKNLKTNKIVSRVLCVAATEQNIEDIGFLENRRGSNLGKVVVSDKDVAIKVKGVPFKDLLKKYKPVFVKMDIEGYEYNLLNAEDYPHLPSYLFVEIHFKELGKLKSIHLLNNLAKKGYVIKYAVEEDKHVIPFPSRRGVICKDCSISDFIKSYPDYLEGAGEGAIEFLFVLKKA
ncbi:MAG: FkbM family methyltransferase [Caldisphaeraceae archaeon]|nr:FkbM family methyltransferase [Caldisphaeraceae archaeon]